MKKARVAYAGAIHEATPHGEQIRLADGRVLEPGEVVWLPPFEVGAIIALGLNYADHLKELSGELTVTTAAATFVPPTSMASTASMDAA